MKKINLLNPKIFLGIPLAIISLEIYLGIILGYFGGKFFSEGGVGQPQIIKSIIFNIGNYQLHFHHWLTCLIIFILALSYNFFPFFPRFLFGLLGGLIFQDIRFDRDWYKIFKKQKCL